MSELQFDYHYGDEAEQYVFYRIPKALFTNPRLKKLSTDAKLLYGLMLDRMSLSRKNNWFDKDNKVYIFFTHDDIQDFLDCASGKSTRLLNELEEVGLIHRERQGQGRPTKIYVMRYLKPKKQNCEKGESQTPKDSKMTVENTDMLEITPVSTIFSKNAEETEFQTFENRKSRIAKIESLDLRKSKGNNTETNNTDLNNLSISLCDEETMDRLIDDKKEQIDYAVLLEKHPYEKTTLEKIVTTLVEVDTSTRESYSVNGTNVSAALIKKRLSELESEHIGYVLECLDTTNSQIKNIRAYLIASLYNAPQSIDLYYEQQVRADGSA